MIERNQREFLGADGKQYVDYALDGVDRMRRLIDGLMRFAQVRYGLALCREIVERHGGNITLVSAPGAGTAVSFSLPDAEAT